MRFLILKTRAIPKTIKANPAIILTQYSPSAATSLKFNRLATIPKINSSKVGTPDSIKVTPTAIRV